MVKHRKTILQKKSIQPFKVTVIFQPKKVTHKFLKMTPYKHNFFHSFIKLKSRSFMKNVVLKYSPDL